MLDCLMYLLAPWPFKFTVLFYQVVLKMLPEMGTVENIPKFIEGVREQVNLMLETTWFYFGLVMSLSINILILIPLNSLEDEDI